MAPELVSDYIEALPAGQVVLDPMMGSGTFVVAAAQAGHYAVGVDSDPLALIIAAASVWQGDESRLLDTARFIVSSEANVSPSDVLADDETQAFVDFWFDPEAQRALASIADRIARCDPVIQPPLWCAFSRLIITKDAGASRARDVSHSRPHVVRELASFDPVERFVASVQTVLSRRRTMSDEQRNQLSMRLGDARHLPVEDRSVDAIMTSPPYLTAIDYLRGHRMSLVWMGHSIGALRRLRGENIGSERGAAIAPDLEEIRRIVVHGELARARERIVNRYLIDLDAMLAEAARVLRRPGHLTLVVANSMHAGSAVRVDEALSRIGLRHGFVEERRVYRPLPENRRYLPPPGTGTASMDRRMRTETILRLAL